MVGQDVIVIRFRREDSDRIKDISNKYSQSFSSFCRLLILKSIQEIEEENKNKE